MKTNSWGVVTFVGTVLSAAAVIAGPPLKVTAFTPVGLGLLENLNADGMAKLKFYIDPVNGPSIEAHVHLYDFLPGTTYSIDIQTDQGGQDFADVVSTNAGGNGNANRLTFPVSAEPDVALITIYRDVINDNQRELGEERAMGSVGL